MSSFIGLYAVRDYKPEDKKFILASFLRGLYYGDSWFSIVPKGIFMSNYKKIAEYLVDSPKNTIKIACLKDDPDVILGYSILSSDYSTIHWVFVKKVWRLRGVARSLTPQRPTVVTHLSALGKSLLDTKIKEAIFNPFQL